LQVILQQQQNLGLVQIDTGNCDFQWDSSATPTVTSIDKSNFIFKLENLQIINEYK